MKVLINLIFSNVTAQYKISPFNAKDIAAPKQLRFSRIRYVQRKGRRWKTVHRKFEQDFIGKQNWGSFEDSFGFIVQIVKLSVSERRNNNFDDINNVKRFFRDVHSYRVVKDHEEDIQYVKIKDAFADDITFLKSKCASKQVLKVSCEELGEYPTFFVDNYNYYIYFLI